MEDNRTSSTIVHVKYLSQNRSYGVRMQFYELQTSPTELVLPESEVLGHDERTNLPIFAPFGSNSNKIKPFIRARLIRLLRSNLWHNLIENRDLLKVLVSAWGEHFRLQHNLIDQLNIGVRRRAYDL
jgi:hypothetical protein